MHGTTASWGCTATTAERARVAFSCKGRGFCSSCAGRPDGGHRRASGRSCAAPRPHPTVGALAAFRSRYRLAYDARLVRDVLQIFISAVFRSLRQRVRAGGRSGGRSAARSPSCSGSGAPSI